MSGVPSALSAAITPRSVATSMAVDPSTVRLDAPGQRFRPTMDPTVAACVRMSCHVMSCG
jgi:hypothetical protein